MSLPAITSPALPQRTRWLKRTAAATALVAATGTGSLAVPVTREPILRHVGSALIADEPVMPADAILIAVDAERAGVVEAADLYHQGLAPRVIYFQPPLSSSERELVKRGIADPRDDMVRELRLLGVEAAERLPGEVGGTRAQGAALRKWSAQRGYRSVLVVTQGDHSARVRRVLDRAMEGSDTRVTVRVSRYSDFDPDSWFESEAGIRTAVEELLKLAVDVATHPLS